MNQNLNQNKKLKERNQSRQGQARNSDLELWSVYDLGYQLDYHYQSDSFEVSFIMFFLDIADYHG